MKRRLNIPAREASKQELQMARSLVESMTSEWEPERYHDDYREKLEGIIQEKLEHPGGHAQGRAEARRSRPRWWTS